MPRTTKRLTIGADPGKSKSYALSDPRSLELRYGSQDVHLESAGRRSGIDPLSQRHEVHAEGLELLKKQNQHRATLGLPPLPDLTTVTHNNPATAPPKKE